VAPLCGTCSLPAGKGRFRSILSLPKDYVAFSHLLNILYQSLLTICTNAAMMRRRGACLSRQHDEISRTTRPPLGRYAQHRLTNQHHPSGPGSRLGRDAASSVLPLPAEASAQSGPDMKPYILTFS
jgi:hypothetical protein